MLLHTSFRLEHLRGEHQVNRFMGCDYNITIHHLPVVGFKEFLLFCREGLKHPPPAGGGIRGSEKIWVMTSLTVGLLTRRTHPQTAVS
ncbi:MAG: hypothetical protein L0Z53_04540, partial [Acidobacteriales bacterium]|nr:hypothetical protein [Terriglobales bacterium]